jgi:hypothetical protein
MYRLAWLLSPFVPRPRVEDGRLSLRESMLGETHFRGAKGDPRRPSGLQPGGARVLSDFGV